jgi:hypothetical protein
VWGFGAGTFSRAKFKFRLAVFLFSLSYKHGLKFLFWQRSAKSIKIYKAVIRCLHDVLFKEAFQVERFKITIHSLPTCVCYMHGTYSVLIFCCYVHHFDELTEFMSAQKL